jgi:hypothetical protein
MKFRIDVCVCVCARVSTRLQVKEMAFIYRLNLASKMTQIRTRVQAKKYCKLFVLGLGRMPVDPTTT